MAASNLPKFIVRLAELVPDAFDEDDFSRFIFQEIPENEFDFVRDTPPGPFGQKVFFTVRWANKIGGPDRVLWLAKKLAEHRPLRTDLAQLALEIETSLQQAPAQPGPAGVASLPNELIVGMALVEEQLPNPLDHARDLRDVLRRIKCDCRELASRFHLSRLEIDRLVAILALEKEPDARYLRWLSERVAVERPFIALMGAKALTAASLRLAQHDLGQLTEMLENASDLLDGLIDDDLQPAAGFDISTVKDQIRAGLAFAEMRIKNKYMLSGDELNDFALAMIVNFDRDSLDLLCRKYLESALKFLANPNDPMDLIVIHVVLTCRGRFDRELIRGVHEERPALQNISALYQKYVVSAKAS